MATDVDRQAVLLALASVDAGCVWSTQLGSLADVLMSSEAEIRSDLDALVALGLLVRARGLAPFRERGRHNCWFPAAYAAAPNDQAAAWDQMNRHPANVALRALCEALDGGEHVRPRAPGSPLERMARHLDEDGEDT